MKVCSFGSDEFRDYKRVGRPDSPGIRNDARSRSVIGSFVSGDWWIGN
jgi:hypothetical protein